MSHKYSAGKFQTLFCLSLFLLNVNSLTRNARLTKIHVLVSSSKSHATYIKGCGPAQGGIAILASSRSM
jgi:hypothetical protein